MLSSTPVPLVRTPEIWAALLAPSDRVTGKPELAVAATATLLSWFSGMVWAKGWKTTLWVRLAIV